MNINEFVVTPFNSIFMFILIQSYFPPILPHENLLTPTAVFTLFLYSEI